MKTIYILIKQTGEHEETMEEAICASFNLSKIEELEEKLQNQSDEFNKIQRGFWDEDMKLYDDVREKYEEMTEVNRQDKSYLKMTDEERKHFWMIVDKNNRIKVLEENDVNNLNKEKSQRFSEFIIKNYPQYKNSTPTELEIILDWDEETYLIDEADFIEDGDNIDNLLPYIPKAQGE